LQGAAKHQAAQREIFQPAHGALAVMPDSHRQGLVELDTLMTAPVLRGD
jgi:hypothetical protein